MARNNIEHRRKVRALEAKRDKLIVEVQTKRNALAAVRAELKQTRKQRN